MRSEGDETNPTPPTPAQPTTPPPISSPVLLVEVILLALPLCSEAEVMLNKFKSMTLSGEQTIAELRDVSSLVKSQVEVDMPEDEVVEALFSSWIDRLAGLTQSTPGEKASITYALASGPMERCPAPGARSGNPGVVPDGSTKKRETIPNHKCILVDNFIPEEVWVKLKDIRSYSQLSRASVLAGLAHSNGLECPDQPTLYRMVSIIAYYENNYDMTQEEVHKLMDNIQSFTNGAAKA